MQRSLTLSTLLSTSASLATGVSETTSFEIFIVYPPEEVLEMLEHYKFSRRFMDALSESMFL